MDTITFIRQALTQVHERLMGSLDGLGEADVTWRPAPAANTILEIALHVARADDRMGRRRTGLGTELWDSAGWRERLGFTKDITANGSYQFLKRDDVKAPRLETVAAYLAAIHADTLARLAMITANDLDRVPDPREPDRQVATFFRHMITHKNNHHGQIDYVRGLREPGWDLAPGTGLVQR